MPACLDGPLLHYCPRTRPYRLALNIGNAPECLQGDPDALCPTCRRKEARRNISDDRGAQQYISASRSRKNAWKKYYVLKHSYKVMTGIGHTHPTSGRSTYEYKRVRGTPTLSTRVPSENDVHATASSSPSLFLSSNSNSADALWAGWGFADSRFAQLRSHMTVKMLDNVMTVWGATRTGQACCTCPTFLF